MTNQIIYCRPQALVFSMVKTMIFTLLFLLLPLLPQAQQKGKVEVIQSAVVDSLVSISRQPALNKTEGFRIQVFMESGNQAVSHAQETIANFEASYPGLPAYLSFGQPYYRVRVGNFRTRLEAESQLRFIIISYPKAFVIKETIEPPALYPPSNNNPEP